jgi:hypothetical protein
MAPAIDWTHYDQLKAQGLADREIARRWGIPWGTFHREKQKARGSTVHGRRYTVHPRTVDHPRWTASSPISGPPWRPSSSRSAHGSKR